MKKIRVPLTNLNWIDIMTWKKVDLTELSNEVDQNQFEKMKKVSKRIQETQREDWKVFVEWLGRVNM